MTSNDGPTVIFCEDKTVKETLVGRGTQHQGHAALSTLLLSECYGPEVGRVGEDCLDYHEHEPRGSYVAVGLLSQSTEEH